MYCLELEAAEERDQCGGLQKLVVAVRKLAAGHAAGLYEGRIKEAARAVLTVLQFRGLEVADAVREHILTQSEPALLERWLEKAVVATSAAAVIDKPN